MFEVCILMVSAPPKTEPHGEGLLRPGRPGAPQKRALRVNLESALMGRRRGPQPGAIEARGAGGESVRGLCRRPERPPPPGLGAASCWFRGSPTRLVLGL